MKIGIFDSGLGGLLVTQAIAERLPEYDLVYLGDTARVPYGDRSQTVIYQFVLEAVSYLFEKEDCHLVILACNTASAEALRRLQQDYLPTHYPERRILGVIIPTAEALSNSGKVGVLATRSTVVSNAFPREITKLFPEIEIQQVAAPLLVPLIENNALSLALPLLENYLKSFEDISQLVLGCTHYGMAKEEITKLLPGVSIISQEEVVPRALASYLEKHPEHESRLSKNHGRRYLLTDLAPHYPELARKLSGESLKLIRVKITND